MLDDEKKSTIEEEERYRHEIAKKIGDVATRVEKDIDTSTHKIWAKIYDILNSNVGLLVFSSVFISGGAAFYQNMQHSYESRVTSQKEIISCEFEIANRLYVVKNLISHAKTVGDALEALTGAKKSLGPVKPEFQNPDTTYVERRVPVELEDEAHELLDNWLKSKGFDPREI